MKFRKENFAFWRNFGSKGEILSQDVCWKSNAEMPIDLMAFEWRSTARTHGSNNAGKHTWLRKKLDKLMTFSQRAKIFARKSSLRIIKKMIKPGKNGFYFVRHTKIMQKSSTNWYCSNVDNQDLCVNVKERNDMIIKEKMN